MYLEAGNEFAVESRVGGEKKNQKKPNKQKNQTKKPVYRQVIFCDILKLLQVFYVSLLFF